MRAGALRHLVTIQRPGGSRDAVGARVTSWTDVATNVAAEVAPLSSLERFRAAELQAETSHTVTVRYSPDIAAIDATWRVLFGSRVLVLNGAPINVDERNAELQLPCVEGLRSE